GSGPRRLEGLDGVGQRRRQALDLGRAQLGTEDEGEMELGEAQVLVQAGHLLVLELLAGGAKGGRLAKSVGFIDREAVEGGGGVGIEMGESGVEAVDDDRRELHAHPLAQARLRLDRLVDWRLLRK